MYFNKFKIGMSVFVVTNNQKLVSGVVVGFTDYSVGKQPVIALEKPNEEGWTHVVLTEALQRKCAFKDEDI